MNSVPANHAAQHVGVVEQAGKVKVAKVLFLRVDEQAYTPEGDLSKNSEMQIGPRSGSVGVVVTETYAPCSNYKVKRCV